MRGGGGICGGVSVRIPQQICDNDGGGTGFPHCTGRREFVSFIVVCSTGDWMVECALLRGGKPKLVCVGYLGREGEGSINPETP